MLHESHIHGVERLLNERTTSTRVEHAKDRVSAALTELVMRRQAPARNTENTDAGSQAGIRAGNSFPGGLSRKTAAKKGTGKGTPGDKRKREFDDGAASTGPSPQGGTPSRKGMSHSRQTGGNGKGKTRQRRGGARKPAPGRGGGSRKTSRIPSGGTWAEDVEEGIAGAVARGVGAAARNPTVRKVAKHAAKAAVGYAAKKLAADKKRKKRKTQS